MTELIRPKKNNEPLTTVLLLVGSDVGTIGCKSVSAIVSADE